jgi:hypothetical protein
VFALSDAGGVLPDLGTRLPYTRSAAMAAPLAGAQVLLARLRPRHRHRLQPGRGQSAEQPDAPPGLWRGRWHLAAHGPRQRHVDLCQVSKSAMRFLLARSIRTRVPWW